MRLVENVSTDEKNAKELNFNWSMLFNIITIILQFYIYKSYTNYAVRMRTAYVRYSIPQHRDCASSLKFQYKIIIYVITVGHV